jgi:predicted amidohydrolase YtcJ
MVIHPKMFYTRLTELKQPTLAELDEAAPLNPVFLNGSYGGLINSAAMKASGFNKKQLIAEERDQNSGNVTGFIRSSDFSSLKLPVKEQISSQRKIEALKEMFSNYNKYGITGVISGYADLENYNRYEKLSQNGELTVRVTQNFRLPYNLRKSKERLIDSLRNFPTITGKGNEWIRQVR